jgi:hypothetical protein
MRAKNVGRSAVYVCGPMLWPAAASLSAGAESGTASTLEAELVQVTGCNTLDKVFEAKLGDKTMLVQVGRLERRALFMRCGQSLTTTMTDV